MLGRYTTVAIFLVAFGEYVESTSVAEQTATTYDLDNHEIALGILKWLSTSNENILFSPMSISAAMAMLSMGARGVTLYEIDNAFHFDELKKTSSDPNFLHETFQKTLSSFEKTNSTYVANYLVAEEENEYLSKFLEKVRKYYQKTFLKVDLDLKNITEFPKKFSGITALELINVASFRGSWKIRFNKENTVNMDFRLGVYEKQSIEMMSTEGIFPYAEDRELDVQILEMPYDGEHLSMIVILPKVGQISKLISKLTTKKLYDLVNQLENRKVKVKFPKFKMEKGYYMKRMLQKLGVLSLFDITAVLLGISNDKLVMSNILHKTSIETDNDGTEANSSNVVENIEVSAHLRKGRDLEFVADHPFLFAIVEKLSFNRILFLGTLARP